MKYQLLLTWRHRPGRTSIQLEYVVGPDHHIFVYSPGDESLIIRRFAYLVRRGDWRWVDAVRCARAVKRTFIQAGGKP